MLYLGVILLIGAIGCEALKQPRPVWLRAMTIGGLLFVAFPLLIDGAKQANKGKDIIVLCVFITYGILMYYYLFRAFIVIKNMRIIGGRSKKYIPDLSTPPTPYAPLAPQQNAYNAYDYVNPVAKYPARDPRYGFEKVFGMADLKAKLDNISHEIGENGKNGVLLYGDPGNGKTFIAEAWAKEMGLKFLEARWPELASKWINQTAEQVKLIFESAKQQRPCLIFLDEADAMLLDRASMEHGTSTEIQAKQIVDVFLMLLHDCHDFKQSGVVIVAATNFPDQLDQAAFREKRFDFKLSIDPPDGPAREKLMQSSLRPGFSFEPEVIAMVSPRWEGFSVARIMEVTDRACRMAQDLGTHRIGLTTLKAALRDVQGQLGHRLPENTSTLDELHFDENLRTGLKQLALHMANAEDSAAQDATLPRGVLFYGPPGTGKTAVAKALSMSAGWAFLATTGQALQSAPDEMDKLLSKASNLRPCIVFIDEADDIIQDRALNPYGKQATNKLLAAMEGTKPLHDVLFVAATNFRESLDAAAVRDGRFGEHFEFTLPSFATLEQIVRGFMAEKRKAPWAKDFDPVAAAKILEGYAPSDARGRLQKAINRAVANRENITLADLAAVC